MHVLTLNDIIPAAALAQLRQIADTAEFVDGRISNPDNIAKNNAQLHGGPASAQVSQIIANALFANAEFADYALPTTMAPPLMTKYGPGQAYGAHSDAAFMQIGERMIRSDLSCTVFLSDLDSYEGGALEVQLGGGVMSFRLPAGSAIVYPSSTMHQVREVTSGTRLVAITFIESQLADPSKRALLSDLADLAAEEHQNISESGYARLLHVQQNLKRMWCEPVA